jgi:hypothetical protein
VCVLNSPESRARRKGQWLDVEQATSHPHIHHFNSSRFIYHFISEALILFFLVSVAKTRFLFVVSSITPHTCPSYSTKSKSEAQAHEQVQVQAHYQTPLSLLLVITSY